MGRVEETDKYLKEMKDEACAAIRSSGSESIIIAQTIALQTASNEAIAKNLAQLADDIHFIKEAIAKEIEGAESKPSGPKCLRCAYYEKKTTVDDNGLIRNDVDWCMWYRRPINLKKDIDCYKFIKTDKKTGG